MKMLWKRERAGAGSGDIRLVCFSNAAISAGGVAVYAGIELSPGRFSSALVAAKSRLMKGTVPRNELSAIMLMMELVFIVKRAMGTWVKEVIYISDSMIALSCCSSLEKKLHLFVQNRVSTIIRMVQWSLSLVPLYHVEGDKAIIPIIKHIQDYLSLNISKTTYH